METTVKPSKQDQQPNSKPKKLSKTGKAMRAGLWKGTIIELTDDPWNLKSEL